MPRPGLTVAMPFQWGERSTEPGVRVRSEPAQFPFWSVFSSLFDSENYASFPGLSCRWCAHPRPKGWPRERTWMTLTSELGHLHAWTWGSCGACGKSRVLSGVLRSSRTKMETVGRNNFFNGLFSWFVTSGVFAYDSGPPYFIRSHKY